jgi:hypothetical protein
METMNYKELFCEMFDELERAAWDDEKHPGFGEAFIAIVEKYQQFRNEGAKNGKDTD